MYNVEIDVGVSLWTNQFKLYIFYLIREHQIDLEPFNFYVFYDEMKYKEQPDDFRNKLFNKLLNYIEGVKEDA